MRLIRLLAPSCTVLAALLLLADAFRAALQHSTRPRIAPAHHVANAASSLAQSDWMYAAVLVATMLLGLGGWWAWMLYAERRQRRADARARNWTLASGR